MSKFPHFLISESSEHEKVYFLAYLSWKFSTNYRGFPEGISNYKK